MHVFASRPARASLLFALLLLVTSEGWAQAVPRTVANTRREVSDSVWASGNWAVFSVDEEAQDLNGDGDTDDSVLTVLACAP